MTGTRNPVHTPWPGLIEAYRDPPRHRTELEDGHPARPRRTPLLPAGHLSELTGCDVYLKVEGLNPTTVRSRTAA
ncbi:hypothetical protein FXW78_55590 [Rhodococcus opacus]|nr:hypothetical protein [Rhodococcus opacus]